MAKPGEWTASGDNCYTNGLGAWVTYGDFGRDTYGLHIELENGEEIAFKLLGYLHYDYNGKSWQEQAATYIAKIESGWLPVGCGYVRDSEGHLVDYKAAEQLFDKELAEDLHMDLAPCTPQEFFDAYCVAHELKYGEWFTV